jgi:carboxyl-terminal processing protease
MTTRTGWRASAAGLLAAGWLLGLAGPARPGEGLPTVREVLRHFEVAFVDQANPVALAAGALQGLQRVSPGCQVSLLPPPGLARVTCGPEARVVGLDAMSEGRELVRQLEAAAALALEATPGLKRLELERAMLRELTARCGDHWTVFLEAPLVPRLTEDGSVRAATAGLLFEPARGGLMVLDVLPGSPGERAGIRPGSMVDSVAGRPVHLLNELEALALTRGRAGERVELVLGGKRHSLELAPEPNRHVVVDDLGQGVYRVHLSDFRTETGKRLQAVLRKMEASPAGLKALVLDLRANPGGLLTEGTAVAGLFLPAGPVVSVVGKKHRRVEIERNPAPGPYRELPLVVLADHRSASVSEIVIMAFRDAKRAPLVGASTLGKGAVQDVLELQDGSALKLSTGRYYSPLGIPIHEGIEPDQPVDWDGQGEDPQLKRALSLLRR